jgi:hypothetical protein
LRDYIDRIFAESSKVAKKRERIQVPEDFYNKEMDAPVQAPKWTLGGYRGSLKAAIQEAIKSIPGRVEQQQQRPQRLQQASDEPPQEEPADETQTPMPAPQVDEPRSIPPIISSQTSTEEPRVATQSSTEEVRTATQPSSDELSQNIRSSLSSAKKKKSKKS